MKSSFPLFFWLVNSIEAFVVGPHVQVLLPQSHVTKAREGIGKRRQVSVVWTHSTNVDTDQEGKDSGAQETDSSKCEETLKPDILQPFLPAMDPMYECRGPVGEGEFVVSRTGGPTEEELDNENILKIVQIQCSDLEVNTLVWKCLGYRFDPESESWNNDLVFPNWRERYPEPPDFIGMRRIYSKEVDEPSLRCNQSLVRSIPVENKQSLKPALKPLGFRGYQFAELTPNKTRRAQCANWLIYYRDNLYGYTVEELRERRLQRKLQEEQEQLRKAAEGGDIGEDEWKPPVKEVY
ncbi:hypothetical protein ACA910_000454 [Epithemia clementina (nom. ined.)]